MMTKGIEWLKEEIEKIDVETSENFPHYEVISKNIVLYLINQLGESETLSQKRIDDNIFEVDSWNKVVNVNLQNLLVPKQEEVDRAYKDGYEKGKEHTFYKGYLEGIADKESESETVADVIADFFKSLERLKEVLGTKVEELEE